MSIYFELTKMSTQQDADCIKFNLKPIIHIILIVI